MKAQEVKGESSPYIEIEAQFGERLRALVGERVIALARAAVLRDDLPKFKELLKMGALPLEFSDSSWTPCGTHHGTEYGVKAHTDKFNLLHLALEGSAYRIAAFLLDETEINPAARFHRVTEQTGVHSYGWYPDMTPSDWFEDHLDTEIITERLCALDLELAKQKPNLKLLRVMLDKGAASAVDQLNRTDRLETLGRITELGLSSSLGKHGAGGKTDEGITLRETKKSGCTL